MIILAISTGIKTAIMIVLMIVVFYFFIIRPQSQQNKKEREYRESLRSGDRVMTAGGIHATIVSVDGPLATIEIAPKFRVKVQVTTLSPIPEHK